LSAEGGAGDSIVRRMEDGVARIILNRPARMNAFAEGMRERLSAEIRHAGADGARAIVIEGAGRAFSAGADVGAMASLLRARNREGFERLLRAGADVVRAIQRSEIPVIAAVGGAAVGAGASLAAACDLRIGSTAASIGFTFVRVGLHPDWGATFHLPRLVGHGRAADLFLSGRILSASEAHAAGLLDRLVSEDRFDAEVSGVAEQLASGPYPALSLIRSSLGPSAAELEEYLQREIEGQLECFASPAAREGVLAFLEKRAPDFHPGAREAET
jgi:2-(1,2-epoxy-1,2-dihydrophenyl)acetyl-CoA isomerase